jgi:type III secretion system (T3SS) SseB-like protein
MAAYAAGGRTERELLGVLAAARLLVPVVAVLTEADDSGADKSSEMALPTLIGQDGRPAIIAFTGVDAVTRWRPDARPVPVEAARVWQAGVAEADAVVIDIAGPVPVIIEGARLAALAAGQPVPFPYEDPDTVREVQAVVAAVPAIAGARLTPGRPEAGTHVTVELRVAPGADEAILRQVAQEISARLARRMALEITATAL